MSYPLEIEVFDDLRDQLLFPVSFLLPLLFALEVSPALGTFHVEIIDQIFHARQIGVLADLVGQNGDEYVVTDVEEEHDLEEVKELSQHAEGGKDHRPVLIDPVLEIVEEVFIVPQFEILKLFGSVQADHVEEHEGSDEQDDVELDPQVGGYGFFEEKPKHQSIFGLGQIDNDFAPGEKAYDSIMAVKISKKGEDANCQL